jgi:hypothetical protein
LSHKLSLVLLLFKQTPKSAKSVLRVELDDLGEAIVCLFLSVSHVLISLNHRLEL